MDIFIDNKYTKWYHMLMYNAMHADRSKTIDYFEQHHIIPKSLGGTDHNYNLVLLTAREHYIAHLLLVRMLSKSNKYKMVNALARFKEASINSRSYELYKRTLSNHSKGELNPIYNRRWYHDPTTNEKYLIHYNPDIHHHLIKGLPEQQGGRCSDKTHIWINNGVTESMIPEKQQLPTGWNKGRLKAPPKAHLKSMAKKRHTLQKDLEHSNKLKGRITIISPDGKSMRVHMHELESYTAKGYILPTECVIENRYFHSFTLASKHFGLHQSVVKNRVKSEKWIHWNYFHSSLK